MSDNNTTFGLSYMGNIIDAYDTKAEAVQARAELVRKIKANQLPNFLDADDIDGVQDFDIVEGDFA